MKKLILSIAIVLTTATSAFAQLGSLATDLVFTPITPCRIVDTRAPNAGGIIPANSTRGFKAWGASFAAQGGSATTCGIPQSTNIAALELNLVAVLPTGAGYITAYPTGVAQPTASTLNYAAGDIVANGATVKVSQATPSLASDWTVYSFATTHFLADVTGYYAKPVATALQCVTTGTNQADIIAGAMGAAAAPLCGTGFTSTAVFCDTSTFDMMPIAVAANTNVIPNTPAVCAARNSTTALQAVFAYQRCCQIPGR